MIEQEENIHTRFRESLDEAALGADTPEKLLELEDILYDILEGELKINEMLNERIQRQEDTAL